MRSTILFLLAILLLNFPVPATAGKATGEDWPSILESGQQHLAEGKQGPAREEFQKLVGSGHDSLAALGLIGLGDLELRRRQYLEAFKQYRFAAARDPGCLEAYYHLALAGLDYGQTAGHEAALKAFADLLERDPAYRDGYRRWRVGIINPPEGELRRVMGGLARFLAAHPDSLDWRVELAQYHFDLGATDSALALLERIDREMPQFLSPEKKLLEARCRLEQGDSLPFQRLYDQALEQAAMTGDFAALRLHAETIFTPESRTQWENLSTPDRRAIYLNWFWNEIDLDPLTPVNARLVEHYRRLRRAERDYRLNLPHSPFQESEDVHKWLAFHGRYNEFHGELMQGRSRPLGLDQRGMVYLRLGEPDMVRTEKFSLMKSNLSPKDVDDQRADWRHAGNSPMSNPMEIWYYDQWVLVFEKMAGVGDYITRPLGGIGKSQVDVATVMDNQYYEDPTLSYNPDYFVAQFMPAGREGIELEIYQSAPFPAPPQAEAALYDRDWFELERREGRVLPLPDQPGVPWYALHRLELEPEQYRYVLRLTAPDGERIMGRGQMTFAPFPADSLALSAVVLGTTPTAGLETHSRHGIPLLPRPSATFRRGEIIRVYLEFYNLRPDEQGRRSYREWIDVVRLAEGESRLKQFAGKVLGLFTPSDRLETELTHVFQRQADTSAGPVAEVFELDSSTLAPGGYRLLIQARDDVTGLWDLEESFFDIEK